MGEPRGTGPGRPERQKIATGRLSGFWILAIAYSSVGFSIYFALGVVADRGLGLTPLIFLAAGVLFVLTTLTYVEGAAMLRERGGASAFARHAFNEFVAFVAAWAILIDFLIVIALAAITAPHYLAPILGDPDGKLWPALVGIAIVAVVAVLNILDVTGRRRPRALVGLAAADLLLQLAVIGVGAAAIWSPDRLTEHLDLFTMPTLRNSVYAAVLAMLAYAGIEAASNLAPDLDLNPRQLKRVVSTSVLVPILYAGMAAIALMAVPVVIGPDGARTELGATYVEAPVLGVVSTFHPVWLSDLMRWVVALVAAPVLFWAASIGMLGVSRHTYSLAVNRQIPSWLGKLGTKHETPHVAILLCALAVAGLVAYGDVKALAGVYALGATLAISIAHISILRLRMTEPGRERPYRVPLDLPIGGHRLPLPAMLAAVLSLAALVSVFVLHDTARWVGGGWMVFGVVAYLVYRLVFEQTSPTKRVTVSARDLTKTPVEISLHDVLVPIFGSELDDDIVGTAGRLAAEDDPREAIGGARLNILYVIEVPLTVELHSDVGVEAEREAIRAIERARDVAEEYEDVIVRAEIIRHRKTGAGIIEAARRWGVEMIVMGAEPPTKTRGGAWLGGIGGASPEAVGPVTEYVLRKAPCRVLLTAPPESPS